MSKRITKAITTKHGNACACVYLCVSAYVGGGERG